MLGTASVGRTEILSRLGFDQQKLFRSSCSPGEADVPLIDGCELLLDVQNVLSPDRCTPGSAGPLEQSAERLFRRVLAKHELGEDESLDSAFLKLGPTLGYAFSGTNLRLKCAAINTELETGGVRITAGALSDQRATRLLTHLIVAALRAAGDLLDQSLEISVDRNATSALITATPMPQVEFGDWLGSPAEGAGNANTETSPALSLLSERLERVLELAERRENGDEQRGKGIIVGRPDEPLTVHVATMQSAANDARI